MGVIAGNAALPGHVTVFATSTACRRKSVWLSANHGFMPKGTTPLALVHSPHRRSWWWRRFRLIPPSSGVANPTTHSPNVAAAAVGAAAGSADLRPIAATAAAAGNHHTAAPASPLLMKRPALSKHNCAPSAAPAGATISCLRIRCCRTQTSFLRGAPRCRSAGKSFNVRTCTQNEA